eukprot:TRINITY_DN30009_c0_g1_i1.p3 TRINITY_DN30009_c0_g1~~TRINITY_DN30009_c0_g1_i1.p3  ORF type:complete len:103 (-),score=8.91 TRINITY_DN30009_c0_g1_i1:228-536(-)
MLSCLPNSYGGTGCCDTYPDARTDNAFDTRCQAMLQGTNRLQRGINFIAHLKSFFRNTSTAYTPSYGFFRGAHNNIAAYASPLLMKWLLEETVAGPVIAAVV